MGYMINTISYDVPIFSYSFPQVITKKTCKEYRKSFPQSNTSNVQAWHSGYHTHETTDVFDPLIKIVINTCNDIGRYHFNAPISKPYHYIVNNLWLAMYGHNNYTKLHAHFPSTFAACYYVDVKDDCSPIIFGKNDDVSIQPENGMLLIWLGMIPHKVMPTKTERTCICMNISMQS